MGRYIDPRTDFGFKRLFGQEDSKDILRQFLFDVLALSHPIVELTYIPLEQLPATAADRRGIYDVYCVDSVGRRFIVEMQQSHQQQIKERMLFYSTFAITYQSQRGADWQFNLLPVYCIAILDFTMVDNDKRHLRRVQLMDTEEKTIFYEKLTFVYIELAKFKRDLVEDLSPADKWVYLLKHLPALQNIPAELAAEPFQQAFAIAEEAALSEEERWLYEGSLKDARDFNAALSSAISRGMAQGIAQGVAQGVAQGRTEGERAKEVEIVRTMLARGVDPQQISQFTGIAEEVVQEIVNQG
jgi:predicted transposase/invertase (TIGR01784 family)